MRLKSTDVDGDCRYTTSLPLFYFSGLNPNEEEKFVKDASHNSSTYEYANLRCSDKLLHIFHTASELRSLTLASLLRAGGPLPSEYSG